VARITGKTAAGIAESLEQAIDGGRILPGERLPTVRALARDLTVSPVTVAAAYRSLRQRGLVTGEGRQGTRVLAGAARQYLSAPWVAEGIRNLALGNPDPALIPSLEPARLAVSPGPVLYGGRANLPELQERVIGQLREDGIAGARLAVVSGALDGIERVLAASCRPGDRVLVEDPGFPRLLDLVRALGLRLIPVAVDDLGPRPASLDRALADSVRAAIFTPRGQNPTGGCVGADRAGEIRRLLGRYPQLLVVEDDYVGPVAGAPVHTLTRDREHWAHVRSVSKVLGPDLRVAFVAADDTTLSRVETRQRLGAGWVSHILQQICLELMADPATERLLAEAEAAYAARRQAMVSALARRGIGASGRSGINVWVPVDDEMGVTRALLEGGWAVAAGERFRIQSPPGIRITVATLQDGEADAVAARISQRIHSLGWTQAG
jgi:DNA-binding transcriptional MocR family regulator